jgi:hypothetical protein
MKILNNNYLQVVHQNKQRQEIYRLASFTNPKLKNHRHSYQHQNK